MICSKSVSLLLALAVVKVNAGGLAAVAPVAKLTSPLLTNEVLTASAPAFFRAAAPAPILAAAPAQVIAAASAPLFAPTVIGYRTAVPQNVPPFASQVSFVNRALSAYYTSALAAPLAAPLAAAPFTGPFAAAPFTGPFAAAPFTGPFAAATFAAPFTAAPFATPLAAAPLATSFAAPLLRSPFALSSVPALNAALPLRSAFASPLAIPSIGLRSAAVPLHTQAIFGPTPVAAEVAPAGVTTKLIPVEEPASENIPQSDEDLAIQAGRTALEPNRDIPQGDFGGRPDEQSFVDNDAPEEQPSN